MQLASGWFGARSRAAAEQLRAAAELGFAGVSAVPEDPLVSLAGAEEARAATGLGFGAAAWGTLAGAGAQAAPEPPAWRPEDQEALEARIPAVLAQLGVLGARLLIVEGGVDSGAGLAERGDRLLSRVRTGEARDRNDEAVEQITALVAEPGRQRERERQLEQLARFLHRLGRMAPGLAVALAPHPSPAGLLDPHSLSLLLEDPALRSVGYWHSTATAETRLLLGLEDPGRWLDAFGPRIFGATLEDFSEGQGGLPPGEGQVDLQLVAEYLPRDSVKVLSLAPLYPGGVALEACTALDSLGIR